MMVLGVKACSLSDTLKSIYVSYKNDTLGYYN